MAESSSRGDLPTLDLERSAFRFLSDDTESAYLAWRLATSIAPTRAWAGATYVAWTMYLLGIGLGAREVFSLAAVSVLTIAIPPLTLTLGLTFASKYRHWLPATIAFTNTISGVVVSIVAAILAHDDPTLAVILGLAGTLVAEYFGIAMARLSPLRATAAVGTYVLVFQALLVHWMLDRVLPSSVITITSVGIWAAFFSAMFVCVRSEQQLRDGYRRERIIESQRETIAKQQAMLEKELSHQVAERSRELGAVLAKSDVTLDVRALKTGERFAERYRVLSSLGAGGMGAVYEVERVTDGAMLALKCVVGEVSGASAARFAREAEIGARVRHPNLVSIVDVGVASGVPYLVMELVRGGSLESQRSRFGDVAWALPILEEITQGLSALHDAGVVHRDLKPANVLLTESGAKISDFGISRFGAVEDAAIDASADTMSATPKRAHALTATNMVMGTPLYMAPEGVKTAKALDASADVFALGIIAYEMLVGIAPFTVPAFVLAMSGQPIPVPTIDSRVPAPLREMITRALSDDPSSRPRVREIRAAIDATVRS